MADAVRRIAVEVLDRHERNRELHRRGPEPTVAAVAQRGLVSECEALHLDRGYDNGLVLAAKSSC